jgi:tRNA (guanine37-N1)-methyltransferase
MEAMDADAPDGVRAHRVLLTPQGRRLDQSAVRALAARPAIMLVCGRYEGFDERVRGFVDEEISLGDFVMTGGEVAAMAVVDACVRLLPGVLGNEESTREESHSPETGGLLEYPHYTRPVEFRGKTVPEVLVSGNHAVIAKWRAAQALERTKDRRPDLLSQDPPAQGKP